MLPRDETFHRGDKKQIWQKYCGFLDLSTEQFMDIQKYLLMDHLKLIKNSPLAENFMSKIPANVDEFRQSVRLTTFADYAGFLNEKREDTLAVKPYYWVHTSGKGGNFKWVPYTEKALEMYSDICVGMIMMACTNIRGEVNVGPGVKGLHNLPPLPYLSGMMAQLLAERISGRLFPPHDQYQHADFEERTSVGFMMALSEGVDMVSSLTSVLVKMGERFSENSGQFKMSAKLLLKPRLLSHLIAGWLRSKKAGRVLLPKDLLPIKGLLAYGMDTSIYRDKLKYYWGKTPLEIYAATESGAIATQSWNKKYMTFIPSSCFLEFVPEKEWGKSREDKEYQPATVLLDEVLPGERYEVVLTSFYGMPFLRYRIGDLIEIVATEDEETGIRTPQMIFHSRADDLIDIAGFARLDEKTIWQAIVNTGIKHEDWCIRKGFEDDKVVLNLYLELKQEIALQEAESLIHREMGKLDSNYRDLEGMLGIKPLRLTLLPPGAFQRFYEEKKKAGADLAHLKPPHMSASGDIIRELTGLNLR